jgi:hypothetical protein
MNIVDQARELVVHTLRDAARKYAPVKSRRGSYEYLADMASKVESAEAVLINSYLVLDCVIVALKSQAAQIEKLRAAVEPFGKYSDALDAMIAFHGGGDIADRKVLHVAGTAGLTAELKLGDFRRARQALGDTK